MRTYSRLIFNEEPLVVPPTLACIIGVNEAIFVQQLHYWLKKSEHEFEGRKWVYNTYDQWVGQFPFWKKKKIQRIILKLEKMDIVKSRQVKASEWNQTKWYTLNYDAIEACIQACIQENNG